MPQFSYGLLAALWRAWGVTHRDGTEDLRVHHAAVDAHAVVGLVDRRPMRRASADFAGVVFEHLVAPHIDLRLSGDAHLLRRVVGPKAAFAPADRAAAVQELLRQRSVNLDLHGTAMAGGFDHMRLLRSRLTLL